MFSILNSMMIPLERLGIATPQLVAMVDHKVDWPMESDEDAANFATYDEEITFFLMQYPSGRREYRLHEYGRCSSIEYHEVFLRDILAWTYGGPLPKNAVRPGQAAEVISLRVLKGQTAE
jgi:hypothetical protein